MVHISPLCENSLMDIYSFIDILLQNGELLWN